MKILKILPKNRIEIDLENFLIAITNIDFSEEIEIVPIKCIMAKLLGLDCEVDQDLQVKTINSIISDIICYTYPYPVAMYIDHDLNILPLSFYLENKFKDTTNLKFNPEKLFTPTKEDEYVPIVVKKGRELVLNPFLNFNEKFMKYLTFDVISNPDHFIALKLYDPEKYNEVKYLIEAEIFKRSLT